MRPIKFKAKTSDGEWVEGSYIRLVVYGVMKHFILPANGLMFDDVLLKDILIEIDPNTLCQFTGLHDRNGKEIYEGDKVKVSVKNKGLPIDIFGKISWSDGDLCYMILWLDGDSEPLYGWHNKELEVIGNIHDK